MYRKTSKLHRKITRNMREFHNAIKAYSYQGSGDTILELGAGHLNDLMRWKEANIKHIYAVESDHESIIRGHKFYDRHINENLPQVHIINADINKSSLLIKKLSHMHRKFDAIHCNFSINYFNPNDVIKIVEYFAKPKAKFAFIGFDGKRVHEELMKGPINISKGKTILFKVTKCYEEKKLTKSKQKINVFVGSIGIPHDEYLINIDYYVERLAKIGFTLTQRLPFADLAGGPFKSLASKMSKEEKKYSFLNTLVVFAK